MARGVVVSHPVVYPVKAKRPTPDPLRWSLRSVAEHLPHSEVVICGHLPAWVDPAMVTHLPTDQGHRKFVNIGMNLHAALDAFRGETIYWFNDDFFVLAPVDVVPLYSRGPLGPWCQQLRKKKGAGSYHTDHDDWLRGIEGQRQILRQWGYGDDTPCTDLHVPMPVVADELAETLDRVTSTNPDHPHGHFRMIYGAGRDVVEMDDPKPASVKKRIDEWPHPYISTSVRTWSRGTIGSQLRDRFPHPSPYERKEGR